MLWNKAQQMVACVSDVMVTIHIMKHTTIQRLLTCCIFIVYSRSQPEAYKCDMVHIFTPEKEHKQFRSNIHEE